MCRLALLIDVDKEVVETMRTVWDYNPHGWGLVWKKDYDDGWHYELEEWRTVNSDVPIPLNAMPEKITGMFHIRYATINRKHGAVHPFIVPENDEVKYWRNGRWITKRLYDEQYVYAHNGVIDGPGVDALDVDSEIIGDLLIEYIDRGMDFGSAMKNVVKDLNEKYSGTWNIIAANDEFTEVFGYCDDDLVIIMEDGKFRGFASDSQWLTHEWAKKYDTIPMSHGDYIHMVYDEDRNEWIVMDEGVMKKRWKYRGKTWKDYAWEDEEYDEFYHEMKRKGYKDEEIEFMRWYGYGGD